MQLLLRHSKLAEKVLDEGPGNGTAIGGIK